MDLTFLGSNSWEITKTARVVQLADSAAHFGLYIVSVITAEDFAEGRSALFCFGALPPLGISRSTRTGQLLQEPSEQAGSLLISRFLPTAAADLTLNRKHSHLCTLSETRENNTEKYRFQMPWVCQRC